jgi:hypothetical protein
MANLASPNTKSFLLAVALAEALYASTRLALWCKISSHPLIPSVGVVASLEFACFFFFAAASLLSPWAHLERVWGRELKQLKKWEFKQLDQ